MRFAVEVWAIGAALCLGHGEGAASLAWPVLVPYALAWGAPRRRRWFCRLTRHRWKSVVVGFTPDGSTARGRQCERCWTIEAVGW